jgi:hypothetical protein
MKKLILTFTIFTSCIQLASAQDKNGDCDSVAIKNINCIETHNAEISYLLADCGDSTQQGKAKQIYKRKEMREILDKKKKEYFVREMNLSEEEAKVFFPVLEQFENKHRNIVRERKKILVDCENKKNAITDAEAKQINKQLLDIQKQEFDLMSEYQRIFETILSPKKLFLFYNAREKFMRGLLKSIGDQNKYKEFNSFPINKTM